MNDITITEQNVRGGDNAVVSCLNLTGEFAMRQMFSNAVSFESIPKSFDYTNQCFASAPQGPRPLPPRALVPFLPSVTSLSYAPVVAFDMVTFALP